MATSHPAVAYMACNRIRFTDLAKRTGYTTHWLSRCLHGTATPSPRFRRAVADALGRPQDELFLDGGPAPESIPDAAARLVASRTQQGLPPTVTDPAVVRLLAEAVLAATEGRVAS